MTSRGSLFTAKFWLSLYYFFHIKCMLSMIFYTKRNNQTECENSIIDACFWAFMNIKQDNWTRLLLIGEFAYNNAKNVSIGHMPFKLNCNYYLLISYKADINFCSKFKTTKKLLSELSELMNIYRKNLYYVQELWKKLHDQYKKLKSYASDDKLWLNSK